MISVPCMSSVYNTQGFSNTIFQIFSDYLLKAICPDPGSNRGPLDLQSNALPTELSRHGNNVLRIQ